MRWHAGSSELGALYLHSGDKPQGTPAFQLRWADIERPVVARRVGVTKTLDQLDVSGAWLPTHAPILAFATVSDALLPAHPRVIASSTNGMTCNSLLEHQGTYERSPGGFMLYAICIPAQFTAAVAAGEVALMATSAGATTTLVASGGAIVGTATLVPAGGAAATTSTLGVGLGAGTLLAATGVGLAVLGLIGLGCWALADDQKRKRVAISPPASDMSVVIDGTEEDAKAVLAQVEAIIDEFHADLVSREALCFIRL